MNKYDSALNNLQQAFARLAEFLTIPIENERAQAGVIQAFEVTFELFWKLFQKYGEEEGLKIAGPRSALQYALKAGLIQDTDEAEWLSMLEDRNLTVHTYKQQLANDIFQRIEQLHYQAMKKVIVHLTSRT